MTPDMAAAIASLIVAIASLVMAWAAKIRADTAKRDVAELSQQTSVLRGELDKRFAGLSKRLGDNRRGRSL